MSAPICQLCGGPFAAGDVVSTAALVEATNDEGITLRIVYRHMHCAVRQFELMGDSPAPWEADTKRWEEFAERERRAAMAYRGEP